MRPKFRDYSHCQNIICVTEISEWKYNRNSSESYGTLLKSKELERERDGTVGWLCGSKNWCGLYCWDILGSAC